MSIKLSVVKHSIDQDADLPSYGRKHISWQKYSMQQISNLYTSPLSTALKDFICCDDLEICFQQLNDIVWKVSELNMKVKSFSNSVKKDSRSKFQLPDNIKFLKKELNTCHQLWKSNVSDTCNQIFDDYKELRSQYRSSLRHFVISQENEKIKTMCKASEADGKLFWQMLKGSRAQRKTTCFIENDKLINTSSEILDMWASQFSALGKPTIDPCFNEEFRQQIELSVKQTLDDCLHTLICSML